MTKKTTGSKENLIKYYIDNALSEVKHLTKEHKKWYDSVYNNYKEEFSKDTVKEFIKKYCTISEKKDEKAETESKKWLFFWFSMNLSWKKVSFEIKNKEVSDFKEKATRVTKEKINWIKGKLKDFNIIK